MKKFIRYYYYKKNNKIFTRVLAALAIIATLEISAGVLRLIKDISPYALESYSSLQNSFFNNLADHSFIIMGALALTLIVWAMTQDSWRN